MPITLYLSIYELTVSFSIGKCSPQLTEKHPSLLFHPPHKGILILFHDLERFGVLAIYLLSHFLHDLHDFDDGARRPGDAHVVRDGGGVGGG